jgi:LysR family nitrogen assimilation transcriptional regulator
MELRQLRYFVAISEAGSILKAAGKLRVAQPALGQQIAALEHDIGARLLNRSSRGVTLTDAGEAFLEHARVVLADVERAKLAVLETGQTIQGEVVLGLSSTVALVSALPILNACRERLPDVRLRVVEAYSGFLYEWLRTGRLDLALLYEETVEAGLSKSPLLDDRLVFITSATGPRIPKRISLKSLSKWPLVLPSREHRLRRIIESACASLGFDLNVVIEIDSISAVKRATEAGVGATILPLGAVAEEAACGRLRTARIDDESMVHRAVCATNVTRPSTRACTAVKDLIHRVVHDMVISGTWPSRWVGGDPDDS